MPTTKTQALITWLKGYTPLTAVKFNTVTNNVEEFSIVPVFTESVLNKYISGAKRKELVFACVVFKQFSTGYDDINRAAFDDVAAWQTWIDTQQTNRSYPSFGTGIIIEKVENLENMPNLALTDGTVGKYMFQARIIYVEN